MGRKKEILKDIPCGFLRWGSTGLRNNLFIQRICWRQTGSFNTRGTLSYVHAVMMFTATIPTRTNFYFEYIRRKRTITGC